MSFKILIGKPNTGKSKYIFNIIDKEIESKKKVTLLVPSQSRLLEEDNYMSYQAKEGIIGFEISTINEYVNTNVSKYNLHLDSKYISKLDKKLILTNIISKNPDFFNFFNKVKSKSGFLEMLNIYIDIFRTNKLDLEKIGNIEFGDKLLEAKIREIAKVYIAYQDTIKIKYVDDVDKNDLLIEMLAKSADKKSNPDKEYIFFDGYNNFTRSEYELIETMLKIGYNITISLTTDPQYVDEIEKYTEGSIFETSNETLYNLILMAKRLGLDYEVDNFLNDYSKSSEDIKRFSQNIFIDVPSKKIETDNINICITNNLYSEIDIIAREISQKVREGYRYKEFCIFTSNIENYSYAIKQTMLKYNIPVYLEQGRYIENSSLLKYINILINIACYGIKNEYLFELLKLNLNDFDELDISYFENYVLEFNINKYSYSREFSLNNKKEDDIIYDLDKINRIRIKIKSLFGEILELSKKRQNIKSIITAIYNHLIGSHVLKNYETKIKEMLSNSDPEVIYNANSFSQAYEVISDVFNSISKIYSEEEINILTFKEVFEFAIKDLKLKSIPPTLDSVSVLDINLSKIGYKKYIYFVGVNENLMPYKVDEDILFSDSDLIKLERAGLELKNRTSSKYNMQLFNIYSAINRALEKIYFFIESADINSKALRPSSIIQNITQVIDKKVFGSVSAEENDADIDIKEIYSIDSLFEYMVRGINYLDGKQRQQASFDKVDYDRMALLIWLSRYFTETGYLEIINYLKNDGNLDNKSINETYGINFRTSISRLELFKKCPFSYFMNYGLKLKPRKIFNITSMDIGSFMHNVLERFSKYLLDKNIGWHELLVEEVNIEPLKRLEHIIEEEIETGFVKHKDSIKYLVLKNKLLGTMKKVVNTVASSFNQSEYLPFGYEIEFGPGKMFAPIEVDLSDDKKMYLIGKIDRIDTLNLNDKIYARVVDYKSSSRDLSLSDIKEGYSLQLITYLNAFKENVENSTNTKVVPSGMLYFNLSDKLINLSGYINEPKKLENEVLKSLRMKGIFLKDLEVITMMDKNLENESKLIEISKKALLDPRSKRVLDEVEFNNLCSEAKNTLKNIGKEILSGVIKIRPENKKDACKYCNYSSICRKNSVV